MKSFFFWQQINNWLEGQEQSRSQAQSRILQNTAHLPYRVRREIERECYGKY